MSSCFCLSVLPPSKTLALAPSSSKTGGCRCFLVVSGSKCHQRAMRKRLQVVCMAPEEEKLTRRNVAFVYSVLGCYALVPLFIGNMRFNVGKFQV
ncbi:hypothetical protein V6N13_118775 [Hibiscus sabdariffa]|uniref:Uncharacterized protein n=1 Tax=Hibiscus sabdariffa TaxID=183260 RepID=A0ABR2DZT3_9ROSI